GLPTRRNRLDAGGQSGDESSDPPRRPASQNLPPVRGRPPLRRSAPLDFLPSLPLTRPTLRLVGPSRCHKHEEAEWKPVTDEWRWSPGAREGWGESSPASSARRELTWSSTIARQGAARRRRPRRSPRSLWNVGPPRWPSRRISAR